MGNNGDMGLESFIRLSGQNQIRGPLQKAAMAGPETTGHTWYTEIIWYDSTWYGAMIYGGTYEIYWYRFLIFSQGLPRPLAQYIWHDSHIYESMTLAMTLNNPTRNCQVEARNNSAKRRRQCFHCWPKIMVWLLSKSDSWTASSSHELELELLDEELHSAIGLRWSMLHGRRKVWCSDWNPESEKAAWAQSNSPWEAMKP